jgi:glycosyltransferase involved in cell wall biosynthesis
MTQPPHIVYLSAGAGGMFCGSCMHDNALSKALSEAGWRVQLVPTYTPIRTDEQDVSIDQVLFGGINVYLQQKIPLFRYLPPALDRFLNNPRLIRRVTAKAMDTDAKTLGKLSVSMLKGMDGNQRKEVRLICKWISKTNPQILIFSNVLIGGCIEEIKRVLGLPILVTLQGDDVFLDSLNEPYKTQAINRIKEIVKHVDGFIVHTEFFKAYMSQYFDIPLEKFFVTPLGIELSDFESFRNLRDLTQKANATADRPRTIGYLARLAPEKGLHLLVEAFIKLKQTPGHEKVKLKVAGWLSPQNNDYAETQWQRLRDARLENEFEYLGSIERESKLEFLRTTDIFSVPSDYLEPKGLYAIEALAAGVPVIAPSHGAFPELADDTKGIRLFPAGDSSALAQAFDVLLNNEPLRFRLGQQGQDSVFARRTASHMAKSTGDVVVQILEG